MFHRSLELVAHRAEYPESSRSGGRRGLLRRALVDDDLQRVEAAGGNVHKLRHGLEDVRRGNDDLIMTMGGPQKSPHIDIPGRVCALAGHPWPNIAASNFDVARAAKGVALGVQDS